jgi:hypothetical protein
MTARELAELLRCDCESLFCRLMPDAHIDGGELCGHMPDGSKVKMAVRGQKRGRWLNCHVADQKGDPLDLITWCVSGGDTRRSFAWGCKYLGLDREASVERSASPSPTMSDAPKPLATTPRPGNPLGLYLKGVPDRVEVQSYLQERLQVPLEQLPSARCLRFLPRCWHTETNIWPPAMLAPVIDLVTHQHIATHRTWLAPDHGIWRKASIDPAKKALGGFRGGVIPLLRGWSGRPLSEALDGETVMIAEGIENALGAAYLARSEAMRVWAAVSVNNLLNIARVMPPQFNRVVIVRDNDPGNDSVEKALTETVDLLIDQGREVEFLSAPSRYKDVAEFLAQELPIALEYEL